MAPRLVEQDVGWLDVAMQDLAPVVEIDAGFKQTGDDPEGVPDAELVALLQGDVYATTRIEVRREGDTRQNGIAIRVPLGLANSDEVLMPELLEQTRLATGEGVGDTEE